VLDLLDKALSALMHPASQLVHLQLSFSLPLRSLTAAGAALECCKLITLSFRSSLMGDSALELLKDGLVANTTITSLDLSACALTDRAMAVCASAIRARANRSHAAHFRETLRSYPDHRLSKLLRTQRHQEQLRHTLEELQRDNTGLLHLDVSWNQVKGSTVWRGG